MCIVVSYLAASDHSCENIALKISSLKLDYVSIFKR